MIKICFLSEKVFSALASFSPFWGENGAKMQEEDSVGESMAGGMQLTLKIHNCITSFAYSIWWFEEPAQATVTTPSPSV